MASVNLEPAAVQKNRLLGLIAASIVLFVCLHFGQAYQPFVALQNQLTELRSSASSRPASKEIVLLGIDKETIDHVAQWPWPRRVYAEVIDQLLLAGASEIALDIDFSNPSSVEEDTLFSQALERAGGSVILAAFRQPKSVDSEPGETASNTPIPQLLKHAWPASVNVIADQNGFVRSFPYGQNIAGEFVPSLPALISGHSGSAFETITIDYSIDPDTIPVFSLKSLLEGKIPSGSLAGKKVVVGATALELRDSFAVPVHGILAGSIVQVLSAETLMQGRSLVATSDLTNTALGFCVLLISVLLSLRHRLTASLFIIVGVTLAVEAVAFLVQHKAAIVMGTVPLHFSMLSLFATTTALELDARRIKQLRSKVVIENYQNVLNRVFDDNFDAILLANEDGRIQFANQQVGAIFDTQGKRDLNGCLLADVIPSEINSDAMLVVQQLKLGTFKGSTPHTWSNRERSHNRLDVEYLVTPSKLLTNSPSGKNGAEDEFAVCITARDITQLRINTEKLEHLAVRDPMTGALRRSALISEVQTQLSSGSVSSGSPAIAILAFNIHHFAVINGTFGRPIGDAVLMEIARRAQQFAGRKGLVARIDGNTFAVLLTECPDQDHALLTFEALLEQVRQPISIDSNHVQVRLNAGLAGTWMKLDSANQLLAAAETALDSSKQTNSGQLVYFNPSLAGDASRALQIERHLWGAAERGELSIQFQPQVDLKTRRIIGAEALIRWDNQALGKVSPAEFIPIAERSGAVQQIGKFVLWQACLTAVTWPENITLAVNVSPIQFDLSNVDEIVGQVLDDSGLSADRLYLELTETSLLTNRSSALKQIDALRARGVRIALDDFGTGHSSFEYLANLPIDKIKVDQSFIRNITSEPKARPIIYSMLMLSDGLGLKSVCEGIETEEQAAILESAGCNEGQGYLFSKPVESSQFSKLITKETSRDALIVASEGNLSTEATRGFSHELTGTNA